MESEEGVWEDRSDVSFADAAKKAVKKAERERGTEEHTEYDVSLRVTGDPGSSLSEYIVVLRIHD
jgi:hypothetical protein